MRGLHKMIQFYMILHFFAKAKGYWAVMPLLVGGMTFLEETELEGS